MQMHGRAKPLHVAFILTMPNVNSWNGKWTGEGELYCRTFSYTTIATKEKAKALARKKTFYYSFGDGWGAMIEVKILDDGFDKKRHDRKSKGFYSYDWMIESIMKYGKILSSPPISAPSNLDPNSNVRSDSGPGDIGNEGSTPSSGCP